MAGALVPAGVAGDKGAMGGWGALGAGARRLGATVLDYALPPRCPGCGTVTDAPHRFCLACWQALDFLAGPACGCCGEPFELAAPEGTVCGRCLADPPGFDRVRAAVAYGPIARSVAIRLKHANRPTLADTVARAMDRLLDGVPSEALLLPVPLHRWRLWRRGYNQAALIASALGRRHGLAVDPLLLERRRATPMLRGLGRKARARAVASAFRCAPDARLCGRTVVLIDDVLTSGATASACARTLKRAGAARVEVLCWARVTAASHVDSLLS